MDIVEKSKSNSHYYMGAGADIDLWPKAWFLEKDKVDSLDLLITSRYGWEGLKNSNFRWVYRLKSVENARREGDQREKREQAVDGGKEEFVNWIYTAIRCHRQQEPACLQPEIKDIVHGGV